MATLLKKIEEQAILLPPEERATLIQTLVVSLDNTQLTKRDQLRIQELETRFLYPHIVFHPEIAGGAPIIEGTRITVRCIAGYYQLGMSVDEILLSLSHLTSSQVHSALAYSSITRRKLTKI